MNHQTIAKIVCAALLCATGESILAQAWSCGDVEGWRVVACSMQDSIKPDDAHGYALHHATSSDERGWDVWVAMKEETMANIVVTTSLGWPRARIERVADLVARAWAAQPRRLRYAAMPLNIRMDEFWRPGGTMYDRTGDLLPSYSVVFGLENQWFDEINGLDRRFEEVLTHELCHVVDYKAGHVGPERFSERQEWTDAVEADEGRYVSDYARDEGAIEDFAESCAAYLLANKRTTGALRSHIINNMRHRWRYLDRKFLKWRDVVRFD